MQNRGRIWGWYMVCYGKDEVITGVGKHDIFRITGVVIEKTGKLIPCFLFVIK